MGTDIYGFFEIKLVGEDFWQCFGVIPDGRSYEWFGVIAGIRGEPHFHYKERPDDVSTVTSYEIDRSGGGCTYLSTNEIEEALNIMSERESVRNLVEKYEVPVLTDIKREIRDRFRGWHDFVVFCSRRKDLIKEGRAVFWFD